MGYQLCAQRSRIFYGARHRMKHELCLVCGEAGHRKGNLSQVQVQVNSDSSRTSTQSRQKSMKQQDSRKPIQLPLRKQLSSARQSSNFDNLNMDMMKTVDGGVHECDESDDVARGVLGRLENMLLLPGTLHFGSAIHADTFFIDCGADDVFMDAELANSSNIPLVKIPVPIKLRLADGDSSSMITHRTLPLQLHIASTSSYQRHFEIGLIRRNDSNRSLPFLEVSPVSETPIPPDINKEFSSVFSESKANILPSHRSFDCTINLSSSAEPSHGRIYQLTREEDKVMQEWIAENLAKGFIRNSSSPYGAPCFFVKQKDKLRLCMDYRGLNKQTIKDRNPIPLISEMLRNSFYWKNIYYFGSPWRLQLLRIKEGDEPKTAFITKYGQFRISGNAFRFSNAPAPVSTDDELAVSSYDQIHEFYRALVLAIRISLVHLTKLLKKMFHFLGDQKQEASFKRLKDAFARPGFLAHPNDEQPFILETDASDFAISGVLPSA
ncbi:hypothetical protein BASA81_017519 [Batrachochytrium salamandrivorans]|nr:hypothetical protein BASA81_017519 [Batrachochytrium salamandrivorans]